MHTPASNTVASVIPCLRYRDAPAAIDWLCRTLASSASWWCPARTDRCSTPS